MSREDDECTRSLHAADPVVIPRNKREADEIGCFRTGRYKGLNFVPQRYVFSMFGLAACSLAVNFNTNLSITIVSMVNRNESLTAVRNSNECLSEYADGKSAYHGHTQQQGEFLWSTETEGLAIGAAYYGQLVGFIPGGRLAEVYGGKRVLIGSILLSSLLTMMLPTAAHWSVHAFVACRFLIGVGTAPAIPVLFYLISKWIPTTERSIHASLILAGYGVGSFAGFIVAGELCGSQFLNGWPSVFYTGGLSGCLWCLLCYFLVYETPADHPRITPEERHYILKNLPSKEQKQILTIPWKEMLFSKPLWALAIAYFGQFWILGLFNTVQGLYMGTILNLDIVKNGQLSCLPHLFRAMFACICSIPVDWALRRGHIQVGFVRKGASFLNTLVACIGFAGILLAGCNPILNTAFFTIGGLTGDFVTFGVCMACIDIAPDLSGTVSGLLNIVGVVPFFLIPAIVGWVTMYERNMKQWSYVFYGTVAVSVTTTVIYLILGTSDPQPWGISSPEKKTVSINQQDDADEMEVAEVSILTQECIENSGTLQSVTKL